MSDTSSIDSSSISVIRVFLASPSDLADERRIAREAIDEINKTVARPSGFHVDLIGWEDTLSSAGRPQALINKDLEACQMFIGMLWARWGTPPAVDGTFTSGFEEEFALASSRNSTDGKPHLTLFFKDVDPSKISDPGPELSKVLEFKSRIIEEKTILFHTFADATEFAKKTRETVAAFIHNLSHTSRSAQPENSPGEGAGNTFPTGHAHSDEAPVSGELETEATFLALASDTIRGTGSQEISALTVARLRNIGVALGRRGNDDLVIGAHDANLIYQYRSQINLSQNEISSLTNAGLDGYLDENKPLWSWLSTELRREPHCLLRATVVGSDRQRIGAFHVMTALHRSVAADTIMKSEKLYEWWLGIAVAGSVKNAALNYIGEIGDEVLLRCAEIEAEKNNYTTRRAALTAVILGRGKFSQREAARYALAMSFDGLGETATQIVLSGMEELDDDLLTAALDHRLGHIRGKAIEILADRKKITEAQLRRFFGDDSFETRRAAVIAYEANFRRLSDDEAKAALIRDKAEGGFAALLSSYDRRGTREFNLRKQALLSCQPLSELKQAASSDCLKAHDYYFEIARRCFKNAADEMRFNVDNRFIEYWKTYLETSRAPFEPMGAGDKVVALLNEHEAQRRRDLMRQAFDILTARSERQDLSRLRRALDEDEMDPRLNDIDYFGRWGSWEDVSRVIKIAEDYRSIGDASALGYSADYRRAAAAIIKLAGDRLAEIASLEIPPNILSAVISSMTATTFRKLNPATIDQLLDSPADKVRKAAALQILHSLGVRVAKGFLRRHIEPGKMQYYNVTFWLDLCEIWQRDCYRRVAQRELERL